MGRPPGCGVLRSVAKARGRIWMRSINAYTMRMSETKFGFQQARPYCGATFFVWGAWFVLSAALILATAVFVRPFPWLDHFEFLPFVTDKAPLRLEWLWQSNNEHRI